MRTGFAGFVGDDLADAVNIAYFAVVFAYDAEIIGVGFQVEQCLADAVFHRLDNLTVGIINLADFVLPERDVRHAVCFVQAVELEQAVGPENAVLLEIELPAAEAADFLHVVIEHFVFNFSHFNLFSLSAAQPQLLLKNELNEGFLIGLGDFGKLERNLFARRFLGEVDDAEDVAAGDDRFLFIELQGHFDIGVAFDRMCRDKGGAAAADVAGHGSVAGFVGWFVFRREIAEGHVDAAGQAVPGAALKALNVVAGLDQEGHDLVFFLSFDQAGGKGPDAGVLLDECHLQAVACRPVD